MRALSALATVLLLVTVPLLAACDGSGAPRERPAAAPAPAARSLVIIVVDTLRADALGAYGFDGPVSPHLDALARESVLFERCHAQAPWTKPSIASLFTALHPTTHGVVTHGGQFGERDAGPDALLTDVLPEEAVTLAEALGGAGLRTGAFVANPWIRAEHGFAQGFDVFDEQHAGNSTPGDVVLGAALSWIDTLGDEPFFLYVHLMDVHGPYDAPDADWEAVRQSPGLGMSRRLEDDEAKAIPRYLLEVPWLATTPSRDLRTWKERYAAGVHAVDRRIGRFVDELRRRGVLDGAALVVTSDHGEELCERGGWDHGHQLHAEQTHVPLLVRLPGARHGGRRVRDLAALVDVGPTMLAALGVEVPADLDGRGLAPLVPSTSGRDAVFATAVKWRPQAHAMRRGDWLLLADGGGDGNQVFDVATDPGEREDVAAVHPERARELRNGLQAVLDTSEERRLDPDTTRLAPEILERLRALGYVE